MRRVCKRAKVTPFGFHATRHLSASVLWNEGIDIKDVQLILRHKVQATTERYLHRLGMLSTTAARIDQALERGVKVIQLPSASEG
jgi:integrase